MQPHPEPPPPDDPPPRLAFPHPPPNPPSSFVSGAAAGKTPLLNPTLLHSAAHHESLCHTSSRILMLALQPLRRPVAHGCSPSRRDQDKAAGAIDHCATVTLLPCLPRCLSPHPLSPPASAQLRQPPSCPHFHRLGCQGAMLMLTGSVSLLVW